MHIASIITIALLVATHREVLRIMRENGRGRLAGRAPTVPWSLLLLSTLSWLLASSCFFAYYGHWYFNNDAEVRMFIEMYRRECYPFWD